MMFEEFARSYGLIIREVIPHRWVATPTEDHPQKRNGRYKFLGDVGWVQNWATMHKPEIWKSSSPTIVQPTSSQILREEWEKRQKAAISASYRAMSVLNRTVRSCHPYLQSKGFNGRKDNVWVAHDHKFLVIPMMFESALCGVQLINEQGKKKFLRGQRTKGAFKKIDAKGIPIFCEGYATALSIRAVMRFIKLRYCIYVCFSAGNIQPVARGIPDGIVIADNDPNGVGEKAARDTNKPYWLSDTVGEDFNDYHRRVGVEKAAESLKTILPPVMFSEQSEKFRLDLPHSLP